MYSRIFRGKILNPLTLTETAYFPDGVLMISDKGIVTSCGNWEDFQETHPGVSLAEIIRLSPDEVILPGLVDCHVHLPQLPVIGRQEQNLLRWLETRIFPAEAGFADSAYAEAVSRRFFQALLQHGTTMAAVFLTSHPEAVDIAFEAARDAGNRVIMGQNLMDCRAPAALSRETGSLLKETESLFLKWHGGNNGRLLYAWMPRYAITCSEALLKGIGGLRRKYPEAYMHTHLSEQVQEVYQVSELYPQAKHYTDLYYGAGLLGPRALLAHGIYLSKDELSLIQREESSLIHCPGSNFFLKSGRFPWEKVLNHNIRFGLGSDIGAGPDLSLFQVMKDAQFIQPNLLIPLESLFYAATLGAAKALYLDGQIGNLLPGKQADFIRVNLRAKSTIFVSEHPTLQEILSILVYAGDDRLIQETFIAGQSLYCREHRE